MYIILIIFLFIISYFVLNISEQFQTIKNIKNICYYDNINTLYYPKNKGIKIFMNEYLKYCNRVGTIYSNPFDWFKVSKIN